MAPTGEVTLEAVPENVANCFPGYADMAVALGHGDALNSVAVVDRYHTDHYAELDGVSVDKESMTELVPTTASTRRCSTNWTATSTSSTPSGW